MIQDIHVKLNPGLSWQNSIQQEYIYQQMGLKSEEETITVPHLEHRLGELGCISEIHRIF